MKPKQKTRYFYCEGVSNDVTGIFKLTPSSKRSPRFVYLDGNPNYTTEKGWMKSSCNKQDILKTASGHIASGYKITEITRKEVIEIRFIHGI